MRAALVAFAALCAVLLAGCGHSSTISSSGAKKLVLKAADLPGFESFASGPTASLDVQGSSRENPRRFGREGGWVERLRRSGPAWIVVSTADVFHEAKGARSDLAAYGDDFAQMRADGLAKRLVPPKIGDAAIAAELVAPGGEKEFAVAWVSRNASASVAAIGPSNLHLADAVALVRKQQAKIERG